MRGDRPADSDLHPHHAPRARRGQARRPLVGRRLVEVDAKLVAEQNAVGGLAGRELGRLAREGERVELVVVVRALLDIDVARWVEREEAAPQVPEGLVADLGGGAGDEGHERALSGCCYRWAVRRWLPLMLLVSCADEPRRRPTYPVVLKVFGPAACALPVGDPHRDTFTRRQLPWQSDEQQMNYGDSAHVTVTWTPDVCTTPPDVVRCEVWVFGRLYASATGVYSGGRAGMPIEALCYAGDTLGQELGGSARSERPDETRRQADARTRWVARVQELRRPDEAGPSVHRHPRHR